MSMSEASNPLLHHFTSNAAPNAVEIAAIKKEIEQYNIAIEKLQRELRNLDDGRQRYEGLLSPLRRKPLPLELLGEVFAFVIYPLFRELDEIDDLVGYNVGRARNALVDLCLVCRAWRDAAYATPPLWGRLDLYWDSLDVEKVSQWFKRSRGASKSLLIYCPYWYQKLTEDHLNILEELRTEGPFLDRLDLYMIYGPGDDEAHPQRLENLLKPVNGAKLAIPPWDSLRSFGLQLHGAYAYADLFSDVTNPHLPHLRSLHLRLPSFYQQATWDESDQHSVPLNISKNLLRQLTDLTLSHCDWTGCTILALIRWCISVETMTVNFAREWQARVDLDEPFLQVLLPAVQSLRLIYLPCEQIDILRLIRTPSLVELDLAFSPINEEGGYDDHPDDPEYPYPNRESLESSIMSLVKNSTDRTVDLRHLRLRTLFISASSLASILINLPSVTHLTLDEVWFDSTLFKQLEAAGTRCLPRLEVLELLNVPPCFHIPDLYAFVASRKLFGKPGIAGMEGTAGLKELTMTVIPPSRDPGLGLRPADDVLRRRYNLTLNVGYARSRQG